MATKVKLNKVRLSFPDLFEASEYEGKFNYGATFLVTPGSENDKAIRAALKAEAVEKFKEKGEAILKAAIAGGNQKCCYWDGNSKTYDGYADVMALTAKRGKDKGRPLVIGADKAPRQAGDEGAPYAGCYVNATVELWAQDNKFGKSVRCTLLGVQFAADGDAFSAGSVGSEDDFDDLSAEDLA